MKKPPKIFILFLLHVIWIGQVKTQPNNNFAVRINAIPSIETVRGGSFVTPVAVVTSAYPTEDLIRFTAIHFEFGPVQLVGGHSFNLEEHVETNEFLIHRHQHDLQNPHQASHHLVQSRYLMLIIIFKWLIDARMFIRPITIKRDDNSHYPYEFYAQRIRHNGQQLVYQEDMVPLTFPLTRTEVGTTVYRKKEDGSGPFLLYAVFTQKPSLEVDVTRLDRLKTIVRVWENTINYYKIPDHESAVVPYHLDAAANADDEIKRVYCATFIALNVALTVYHTPLRPEDNITFHYEATLQGARPVTTKIGDLSLHMLEAYFKNTLFMILPYDVRMHYAVGTIPISDQIENTYPPHSLYTYETVKEEWPNVRVRSDSVYRVDDHGMHSPYGLVNNVRVLLHHAGSPIIGKHETLNTPILLGLIGDMVLGAVGMRHNLFDLNDLADLHQPSIISQFIDTADRHSDKMREVMYAFSVLESAQPNGVTETAIGIIRAAFKFHADTAVEDTHAKAILDRLMIVSYTIRGNVYQGIAMSEEKRNELMAIRQDLSRFFPVYEDQPPIPVQEPHP